MLQLFDVQLTGPGLSDRGGGLFRLNTDGGELLAFGALLDVDRARHVLEHAVADDGGMLDDVIVSVRIDPLLECVVISTTVESALSCTSGFSYSSVLPSLSLPGKTVSRPPPATSPSRTGTPSCVTSRRGG